MVESERGERNLWVISPVGVVNPTNSKEHCSVIANPLESTQLTALLYKQLLNCANLLALWYDVVSVFGSLEINAIKFTSSSVSRDELVTVVS